MVAPEGITFSVNGGPWINASVPMAGAVKGVVLVSGAPIINNQPLGMIYISWEVEKSAVGLSWDLDLPQFRYVENEHVQYYHMYPSGGLVVPSPGTLNITKYGAVGDYISGSFEVQKSGKQDVRVLPNNPWVGTVPIVGFFRVKRTF
ncbi:hypothetical protein BH23BAC1_BH23BAC1_36820 [soil metagenome]